MGDVGDKQCIHYWILDNKNVGRCQHCGTVKDFGALQEIHHQELAGWHAEIARRTWRGRKPKG